MPALASLEPVKSPSDTREYKYITLPSNNLPCLLISDPETEKSAAALDVRVGQLSDPKELPGLAHFCEHMLFLGTSKYPNENEYAEYLSKHGGSSNAYTASENTNYYFDVTAPHFAGALDIFAQFFIAPLFTESCVDRELNAIESEHKKNLQSDVWRKMQLLKTISSPQHPYHKFGTGDMRTLKERPSQNGIDTRKALLEFHSKFYSASNMRLCVLGQESLSDLEALVTKSFADVVDYKRSPPSFTSIPKPWSGMKQSTFATELGDKYPAFLESEVGAGRVIRMVPIMEKRMVELQWMAPPIKSHYDCKPASFYGNTLGHEGAGSILALLKSKGWANELWAGQGQSLSDFSIFTVHVDCTKEGMEHIPEITKIVLDYLTLVHKDADENNFQDHKRLWEEIQALENIRFQFKPNSDPMNYTSSLASGMQYYRPEDTLRGPSLLLNYRQDVIQEYLTFLKPENMQVVISDIAFTEKAKAENWKQETWYDTHYNVGTLGTDLVIDTNDYVSKMHLPKPNDFIADDFTIFPAKGDGDEVVKREWKDTKPPAMVYNEGGLRVWHKHDDVFRKPKTILNVYVRTPTIFTSAFANCALTLYTNLMDDALNEYAYDASLAGLHYGISMMDECVHIFVGGYNQKLPVLGKAVAEMFCNADKVLNPTRFKARKEEMIDHFTNFKKSAPYRVCMFNMSSALKYPSFTFDQLLKACKDVTLENLRQFTFDLHSTSCLEAIVVGNTTENDCIEMAQTFKETLFHANDKYKSEGALPHRVLTDFETPSPRCVCLPMPSAEHDSSTNTGKGTLYKLPLNLINSEEMNSCLLMSWQIGPRRAHTRALRTILAHLMKEPAFDQLRTKEQLGYIVFTYGNYRHGIDGIEMIVQSERDPVYLTSRVESFLEQFRKEKLTTITDEEFATNIKAVITNLTKKPKKISEMTSIWAGGVKNQTYTFNLRQEVSAELEKLTKEQVLEFFDDYIGTGSKRRLFLVHYEGKTARESEEEKSAMPEGYVEMTDPHQWQSTMALYPAEKATAHSSKL